MFQVNGEVVSWQHNNNYNKNNIHWMNATSAPNFRRNGKFHVRTTTHKPTELLYVAGPQSSRYSEMHDMKYMNVEGRW